MRKVFYSFHFDNDFWRVNMIRNIGSIKGNQVLKPNKWEEIKRKGTKSIEVWIDSELKNKHCTIVLVGSETARRPWVRKEILKSWNSGLGVLAIAIDQIKDQSQKQSERGENPFKHFRLGDRDFSDIARFKKPFILDELISSLFGDTSKDTYKWIITNIEEWVEEAIKIRNEHHGKAILKLK